MDKQRLDFFRQLLDTPSPSGYEEPVQRLWRRDVGRHADDVRTNTQGSVIATVRGRTDKPTYLLLGHADEIGFIIHYIDENGFLYFKPIGGIDTATLVNQRVRILGPKGTVNGVIGRMAIHLMKPEERTGKVPDLTDLCIDIGASTRDEAAGHAPVGTPGIIGENTIELLNGRIAARDVDNKFGCFVVAEVIRRVAERRKKLNCTLIGASTVQEEAGAWGARMVAYETKPTAAIALDVTHATDTPGIDKRRAGDQPLGTGPILKTGVRSNKRLVAELLEAARAARIPVRIAAEAGNHGTDADPSAESRSGIPVATLSTSLRYMHTGVEVADLAEIQQVTDLLVEFLTRAKAGADYTPE